MTTEPAEPAGTAFFLLLVALVLFAPLYKAANRPLPLLLLELAAVGFLLCMALDRAIYARIKTLPRPLTVGIGVLLVYPLVQLLPLPEVLWRALPGHAGYAAVLERFAGAEIGHASHRITLVPAATEYGWLALLPPLACFLAVQRLAPHHVVRLLLAMTMLTGVESLIGLAQVRAGRDSILYLLSDVAHGTAAGTFVNHNHFAAMLGMMLPVVVGLLVYTFRYAHRRLRPTMFAFDPDALAQRVILFGVALVTLLCLIFSGSRAGIASAVVGLAFSSILLRRAGLQHANLIVGVLLVCGIAVAAAIGLLPLLEGITPERLGISSAGRIALSAATLRAAIEFLPFGSGLSTFADIFPRFQAEVFGGYIDHAHNDYLQLLLEIGLAAPLVVGLLFAGYLMQMTQWLGRGKGRSFTTLQIAAGLGLVPLMIHSVFDFGLHMPSNAIWYATLAGVLFHPGVQERRGVPRLRDSEPAPAAVEAG